MIYSGREPSKTAKKQNDISGLIGSSGPVVLPPSSAKVHNDRALYLWAGMSLTMPRKGPKYPYFPWWLYDYRSDPLVQAMTDDQDLAYRRMLDVSWDLGELENNPGKIAALIRFSPRKFASVWKYPLTECWQDNGVGLVNPRLEREREKVDASYRQKKRAGEASGQARKKATDVERALNTRSTDDGQTLNDPDPDPDPDKDKDQEGKREEQKATASRSPRRAAVYWDPKPTWKPNHPSLEQAQLKVEPSHLGQLAEGFPDVDVPAEIRCMKSYAIDNPGWARVKRNWQKVLGRWIRNADQRLRDARFRAKQGRASPAEPKSFPVIREFLDEARQKQKELGDGKS